MENQQPVGGQTITSRIYFNKGMDRISSDLMSESQYENMIMFPIVQTAVTLAKNCNDDWQGSLSKRGGSKILRDNPDNAQVGLIFQYVTPLGDAYDIRQSGTKLYIVPTNSVSWGSGITMTLTSSNRMRALNIGGYCFLTNGTDPLMYTDGTSIYYMTNTAQTCTLTTALTADYGPVIGYGPNVPTYTYDASGTATVTYQQGNPIYGTETIYVNPITPSTTTGDNFNQSYGFLQNGSEIIAYTGVTLNTSNQIVQFTGCTRGYADTNPQAASIGATLSITYGTPPTTPKYLEYFLGRMMAANTPSFPTSLQGTANAGEIYDPLNFIIDNATSVTQAVYSNLVTAKINDGDQITGIAESNDNLLIFKSRHVYMGVGDQYGNPSSFYSLSKEHGTFSNESIASIRNYTFYLNQLGIHAFDGQHIILMSLNVNDLIKGISYAQLSQAPAITYNYKYYISIGTVTEDAKFGGKTFPNAVLVYNFLTEAWFIYTYPFQITSFSKMLDANGEMQMFYGDSQGNTYQYDPTIFYDANPTSPTSPYAIDMMIDTKYMFMQSLGTQKNFKNITPLSEGGQNAHIGFSFVADNVKTDYQNIVELPRYMARMVFPDTDSNYYGFSARISEVSQSPFTFGGFEIEYKNAKGGR